MKPTLKVILEDGFKLAKTSLGGLELYYMDYERIWYDPEKDTVEVTYTDNKLFVKEKIKPTLHGY